MGTVRGQDEVFSGPQVGEALSDFPITQLRGEHSGDKQTIAADPKDQASVIFFWNELGRPGFGLLRTVVEYTKLKQQKVSTSVVLLSDDAEAKRFRGAINLLPPEVNVGVAADGKDGPGLYGLNRNVRMTVLVGKAGKVVGNFALVQPSAQVDGPKILETIATAIGEEPPDPSQFAANMRRMRTQRTTGQGELDGLLRQLLNRELAADKIKELASKIEDLADKNAEVKKDLGTRASRIVGSGRLRNYGGDRAQALIKKWAEAYGNLKPVDETDR